MIIKRARLVETRSGRAAVEMAVHYGEEVDWITINSDQIVYTEGNDNVLWFTSSWRELLKYLTVYQAVSVYRQFKAVWKYSAYIEDECYIRALDLLLEFVSCASKLSDNWQDFLNNNYPFIEDFETVLFDLIDWQNAIVSMIENNDWEE